MHILQVANFFPANTKKRPVNKITGPHSLINNISNISIHAINDDTHYISLLKNIQYIITKEGVIND